MCLARVASGVAGGCAGEAEWKGFGAGAVWETVFGMCVRGLGMECCVGAQMWHMQMCVGVLVCVHVDAFVRVRVRACVHASEHA